MTHKKKLVVAAVALVCVLALSLTGCAASVGQYGIDVNVHSGR